MRFETAELLFKYLFDNNLELKDLDIPVPEVQSGAAAAVTQDVIVEPTPEDEKESTEEIVENSVTISLASGDLILEKQSDGSILVDDFYIEENVCGAGFVILEGRKLHLTMCDDNGHTTVYLPTSTNSKTAFTVHKKK